MMGSIGTGNVVPGVCTLSLGTSGTVYSFVPRPFVDPEGEIAAFCDSTGGWLPLLCTMNVTNTTEMFKALHGLSNEDLETLASGAAPGADGLIFLPFIDGERVPVLPFGSGVLFGLDRRTFNRRYGPGCHGRDRSQPRLRVRADAGAGNDALRGPGDRRRRQEPAVAPDRRRRLQDPGRHA